MTMLLTCYMCRPKEKNLNWDKYFVLLLLRSSSTLKELLHFIIACTV